MRVQLIFDEKCVELTAVEDKHFDWITELRFNLTEPYVSWF